MSFVLSIPSKNTWRTEQLMRSILNTTCCTIYDDSNRIDGLGNNTSGKCGNTTKVILETSDESIVSWLITYHGASVLNNLSERI